MGIIPAYAGSTHIQTWKGWSGNGSSPHTRGAQVDELFAVRDSRIIPAYAGSTPSVRRATRARRGSSPHTRGALHYPRQGHDPPGIIPAYAGSTASLITRTSPAPDHPRIRGEHRTQFPGVQVAVGSSPHTRGARPDSCASGRPAAGSSPHTRGAQTNGGESIAEKGIIPAYAGSTMLISARTPPTPDHLRIRGEHERQWTWDFRHQGSSPHTRGAQTNQ